MLADRYEEYYAAKLWRMIPSVYRALDSAPVAPGPLAEIVNRIGAQAAVLRRSIDRMWEDQSIESCDDWIIPYIGDLLATRIVACLDARAQRVDVAKTIYYRRRKGTVGLLEELASDIAGRDARVVEFFRRLSRRRHNFDPAIGLVPFASLSNAVTLAEELSTAAPLAPSPFPVVEGLSGIYTHTPMGGTADLRHRYGASRTPTAFDEFFHTADFRLGRQSVGWHGIPKLGVFVWWLKTYRVPPSTPVKYANCTKFDQYTFDPTGREVPLFCAERRSGDQFGEAWITPDEWELPGPLDQLLFDMRQDELYPDPADPSPQDDKALAVLQGTTSPYVLMGLNQLSINVGRGRFHLNAGVSPSGGGLYTRYHYGFASDIGAGPYDRSRDEPSVPSPVTSVSGGGNALAAQVASLGATGTLSIDDSLTYGLPGNIDGGGSGIVDACLTGKNEERPVIRATGNSRSTLVITGNGDAVLLLQGLHLMGADLVLAGTFKSVTIRCVTLDPGTAGNAPALFASAADNQQLWPTRLFVEAEIQDLSVQRSITGPIRTRNGGFVETIRIEDSIVQSIPESTGVSFAPQDIYDADGLIRRLAQAPDPLSKFLRSQLPTAVRADVDASPSPPAQTLVNDVAAAINAVLATPFYSPALFARVPLSQATRDLIGTPMTPAQLAAFNRRLLMDALPVELATLAIATKTGIVELSRTTVLGPIAVHRLNASECILDDLAIAEDAQHGCVRFSAYAEGSLIHQPYESVSVASAAPLFRTRVFGLPDYCRLLDSADDAILSGRAGASIVSGAQNGSEMGVFCLEAIALKRRGLAAKFAEYMPIGLVPVWVDAT